LYQEEKTLEMTAKFSVQKKQQARSEEFYNSFEQLDGRHPWMEVVPEGFVSYRVRELGVGKVVYFNFHLAKEMGLISPDHAHQINPDLEKKIIDTFSIQIINEYDELTKRKIDPSKIKPHKYMATRYLQLQHSSRTGKTSGDGRGIWNGVVSHKGKVWDVSSRGTGVTCLAPGAVEANKPLKTGGTEFGYGCGQAELDELLGASILAEAMHLQGVHTERVLCVIDLGKGVGIGVRAAPNLLRPAHLFMYLKQERFAELQAATDYFIDRQLQNKTWTFSKNANRYDEFAEKICDSFAEFIAKLDIDYIFAWLDWDGDNVLIDAGIIDYGSVRQFGIRHDRYRYDDVERFSTNLNEQRIKARLLVQVFVQISEYLKTKKKKPLKAFANHPVVLKFNQKFAHKRAERLLYRMGFSLAQRSLILNQHPEIFAQFDHEFTYFESAKVKGKAEKVADGVNHPALYNMRVLLRELPQFFSRSEAPLAETQMNEEQFFNLILSSYAKAHDAKIGEKHKHHIRKFQQLYKQLIQVAAGRNKPEKILKELTERAMLLNSDNRITGNALIEIVEEIIQQKKRGLPTLQIQKLIDRLIFNHLGFPEVEISKFYKDNQNLPAVQHDIYSRILSIVMENRETI
jgi:uncharacterized protein YdiU (UPF0061 family)